MSLSDVPDARDFVQRAEAHWKHRGGHLTFVRKLICEEIESQNQDFTATQLWTGVQRRDPVVSLASVYRTLSGLAMAGLVKELPTSGGQRMFVRVVSDDPEICAAVVCMKCGASFPLDGAGLIARRQEEQARTMGFLPESLILQVNARCAGCLAI